jgi:hypothetical protein
MIEPDPHPHIFPDPTAIARNAGEPQANTATAITCSESQR